MLPIFFWSDSPDSGVWRTVFFVFFIFCFLLSKKWPKAVYFYVSFFVCPFFIFPRHSTTSPPIFPQTPSGKNWKDLHSLLFYTSLRDDDPLYFEKKKKRTTGTYAIDKTINVAFGATLTIFPGVKGKFQTIWWQEISQPPALFYSFTFLCYNAQFCLIRRMVC